MVRENHWILPFQFVLGFLCVTLVLHGCSGEEEPPPPPVRAIKWVRVAEGSGEQVRMISGTVTAVDRTELAFEVGGLVQKVSVRLGDRVRKGKVLASLDQQPFMLKVHDAEAALAAAKAEKQAAAQNYERVKLLFEAANASKAQLDEGGARLDSAESAVRAAEARLGLARRDLNMATLRAPFTGSVAMKDIQPAQEKAQVS